MLFERRAVDQTEHTLLAHSIKLDNRTLKKGHVLTGEDIAALEAGGHETIVVACLEPGDVAEDYAAGNLAQALGGRHIETTTPFTGRCNLRASTAGLLILDQQALHSINLVDESLTIATLPPFSVIAPQQLVATVKVIPFAVREQHLQTCLQLAREHAPLVQLAPFPGKKIGFIQSRLPGGKTSVLDKTSRVLTQRLQRLQGRITGEVRCSHDEQEIAGAIEKHINAGVDMVILSGASAIIDRRDVIPSAIVKAGGEIVHFGMPVDPGNLLLLARRGERPILGLPGCARSPKLNGFDWVLERLLADIPVTAKDIMRMGLGGLLKDISTRPQSRVEERGDAAPAGHGDQHRITAIVLAAGTSSRTGDINKLLMDIDGLPMVAHAVNAALGSRVTEVIVVTGHQHERIEAVLQGESLRTVYNPDYARGMSTSLAAGIATVGSDANAVIICLSDMPKVTSQHINRLIDAFDPIEGHEICVPIHNGKHGNPVLWSRRFLEEMSGLSGDTGARQLIREYSEVVAEVDMPDPGVLLDIDSAT